jgi:hypothetical protein
MVSVNNSATLSVARLYSTHCQNYKWMMTWNGFRRKWSLSNASNTPVFIWKDWGIPRWSSVRIPRILTETRTEHFSNTTRTQHCRCDSSFVKYIQAIHKRMMLFQKLLKNVFLTLHGHNITVISRNCPNFSCAASSLLLMLIPVAAGTSFQDGVTAGEGFLCAPFWGVQICDYSAAWVSCKV